MRTLLSRYALSMSAATALLAGCGGSQPPIGALGTMPQSAAAPHSNEALVAGNAMSARSLHLFQGTPSDGDMPLAGLTLDSSGALYGTTYRGGTKRCGTVFKLTPAGSGYVEAILHSFKCRGSSGVHPFAAVLLNKRGALYGTTFYGGAQDEGTVYKLTASGSQYVETVLYSFKGNGDGTNPRAALIADANGALYGTTSAGGDPSCGVSKYHGCGTVFKLTPSGSGYSEKILYHFHGQSKNDGSTPVSSLIFGDAGSLYGTTAYGGSSYNDGTVFRLSPSERGYSETILYRFRGGSSGSGSDGSVPAASLLSDSAGALYGTTLYGGLSGVGTVFKLTPRSGVYVETLLHAFDGSDGAYPAGALIANETHKLYGTASGGSCKSHSRCGTVFRLTRSGSSYTFSTVFRFSPQARTLGAEPQAGLIFDEAGNFYGTTSGSGSRNCYRGCGGVFELMSQRSS